MFFVPNKFYSKQEFSLETNYLFVKEHGSNRLIILLRKRKSNKLLITRGDKSDSI